jgi:hypothetical protein
VERTLTCLTQAMAETADPSSQTDRGRGMRQYRLRESRPADTELEHLADADARVDGALVPCRHMSHRGIELLLSAQPLVYPIVLFRWSAAGPWPDIITDGP